MTDTRETVYVSPEERDELLALVARTGEVEVEEESEVEGFSALLAIVLVGAAAAVAGLVEHWMEKKKGGQVIDLRPGAAKELYRDEGLQYGLVVIYAADGKVTIEVKQPEQYFTSIVKLAVDALQGIAEKSLDTVKAAVEAATGDKGDVTVEAAA